MLILCVFVARSEQRFNRQSAKPRSLRPFRRSFAIFYIDYVVKHLAHLGRMAALCIYAPDREHSLFATKCLRRAFVYLDMLSRDVIQLARAVEQSQFKRKVRKTEKYGHFSTHSDTD